MVEMDRDKELIKLLEDVATHLKKYDGFHMEEVDYPGYPDARESEAQSLYRRINRIVDWKED